MKPTEKSPAIDNFLKSIGHDRITAINNNTCAFKCASPNTKFRNAISEKEYTISGICQDCQDDFFGKD